MNHKKSSSVEPLYFATELSANPSQSSFAVPSQSTTASQSNLNNVESGGTTNSNGKCKRFCTILGSCLAVLILVMSSWYIYVNFIKDPPKDKNEHCEPREELPDDKILTYNYTSLSHHPYYRHNSELDCGFYGHDQKTGVEYFPWAARLVQYGITFCQATLIATNWFVVAAHCVEADNL